MLSWMAYFLIFDLEGFEKWENVLKALLQKKLPFLYPSFLGLKRTEKAPHKPHTVKEQQFVFTQFSGNALILHPVQAQTGFLAVQYPSFLYPSHGLPWLLLYHPRSYSCKATGSAVRTGGPLWLVADYRIQVRYCQKLLQPPGFDSNPLLALCWRVSCFQAALVSVVQCWRRVAIWKDLPEI